MANDSGRELKMVGTLICSRGRRNRLSLDYAAIPSVRRRQLTVLLALAALVLGFATWRWGRLLWVQAELRYWQRMCLSYDAPSGQIVYEDAIRKPAIVWDHDTPIDATPAVQSNCPQVLAREVRCWDKLALLRGQSAGPQQGILFLHDRCDQSGRHGLVEVQINERSETAFDLSGVFIQHPGDPSTDLTFGATCFVGATFIGGHQTVEKFRIYAGQPDPKNSSRFIIPIELGTRKGVIEGTVVQNVGIDLDLKLDPAGEEGT